MFLAHQVGLVDQEDRMLRGLRCLLEGLLDRQDLGDLDGLLVLRHPLYPARGVLGDLNRPGGRGHQ